MDFSYTLEGIRQAMMDGLIREWVRAYLKDPTSESDRLAAFVYGQPPKWEGPVEVEMDKHHRVAGPGTAYRYPKDPKPWNSEVEAISVSVESPLNLPPIIVRPEPNLSRFVQQPPTFTCLAITHGMRRQSSVVCVHDLKALGATANEERSSKVRFD